MEVAAKRHQHAKAVNQTRVRVSLSELNMLDAQTLEMVEAAALFAEESSYPEPEAFLNDVYADYPI